MKKEEAIFILNKIKPTMRRADGKSTSHILETIALDMAIKALEQEPCDNIKEYYKDIWDCDINHPRYEDTVAEIVEKSYMSGYVQGVENTAKEFRFELEQERWIPCSEKLPNDRREVLVTAYWHETYQVMMASYFGDGLWWCVPFNNSGEHTQRLKPKAWMPLPEKYKAGTESKE